MANVIKYTTTNTTRKALRKGNMAVGIGEEGYGPTSNTGYVAGIDPPEGGYVVYVMSGEDEPAIYVANNDSDLINIARTLGGGELSVAESKVFLAKRDNTQFLNSIPRDTTSDGVVLHLDAQNISSYPGSGTEWLDIGGAWRDQTYTLYGLTYPESSQSPSSRHGITPGFDVTSGTKLYDASRDVNYYVFNEDNNTWVADSYFNGERIDGHCYDTYDGQPNQHEQFNTDFDTIHATFPNATHIVIASHAAERFYTNAEMLDKLKSIGLPEGVAGNSRPEFVLAGKVDKPWTYKFAYENISSAVAKMNLGLPLEGRKGDMRNGPTYSTEGHITFDGVNDYVDLPNDLGYSTNKLSVFSWWKRNGNPPGNYHIICGGQELEISIFYNSNQIRTGVTTTSGRFVNNTGNVPLNDGNWHYVGFTFDGSTKRAYIDGVQVGTQSVTGTLTTSFSNRRLGRFGGDGSYYANGDMRSYKVWDKVLSSEEIYQNYLGGENLEIDGDYLKVFRQDSSTGEFFSSANNWAEAKRTNVGSPNANKYSILDRVREFKIDGKYTFKIVYPNEGITNIWSQTNNPVVGDGKGGVTGYEPIEIQASSNGWGGLERYDTQTSTFLDGTLSPQSNWYYAIGSQSWSSSTTFPGPSSPVSLVELWIKYK